jgi:ubiquinone/menaquinone biosynthesis C-methylase UbiE
MRYMPRGTRLTAIEPSRAMHPRLRAQAERYGVELELHDVFAEQMPLESGSVDVVLATLVLCTVGEPARVLEEVVRVLRPGGRFVCLEHVRAPTAGPVRALQSALRAPWRWAFEGCDLCRDTGAALQSAGFASVEIEPVTWRTAIVPIHPMIVATCVR